MHQLIISSDCAGKIFSSESFSLDGSFGNLLMLQEKVNPKV